MGRDHSSIRTGLQLLAAGRLLVPCLLLVAGWLGAPLLAQQPSTLEDLLGSSESTEESDGAFEPPTTDELALERAGLGEKIEALRARLRAEVAESDAAADGALTRPPSAAETSGAAQLRWLEKARSLVGQQIDELRRNESLDTAESDFAALREQGVEELVDAPPPFGFESLDRVLSRRESALARSRLLEDSLAAAAEALEESQRRLRRAEQEQRQLRERLESAEIGDRRSIGLQLELGESIERAAEEELARLRLRVANDRRELALMEQGREFLANAVDWIRQRLQPTAEQLQARLADLEDRRQTVRGRLDDLQSELETAQTRLLRAEGETAGDGDVAGEEIPPQVRDLRQALELLERRQRLLEDHADRLDAEAELWRHRHRLAAQPSPDGAERAEIQSDVDRILAELKRDRRVLDVALQDLRSQAARLDGQLGGADAGSRDGERRRLIAEQIDFLNAELTDVDQALTLTRRVEAEAAVERFDAAELASLSWRRLVSWWNWPITVVDQRPITLGKVLIALLLLIAGYVASKRLSSSLGHVLRQRFGVSSGGAAALQNIAFYLMVVAFLLWAMRLVSIPLTVFTLLGGVLAIGIGFGSQNVVNNFISGLILMVERPVKVGDLIEVDGTVGTVERIGLRSARVRAGDNTHVIVPNSTFLEQKVLNWTISDDLVRTQVDVGIAYGSPTREAAKLMEEALKAEPLVVQNMPKEVLFIEFGDNALLMRAYFWIHVRGYLDKLRAESQLRFRIDDLFRDADITIAFPQRDVHLDTLTPLEVRVLDRKPESEASETD